MRTFSIISLMMEVVRTSETSVYFNETTWRSIPDGCHIQETVVQSARYVMSYDDVCHLSREKLRKFAKEKKLFSRQPDAYI
jgi:hypothetical protein